MAVLLGPLQLPRRCWRADVQAEMNRVKGKPLYRELRGQGSVAAQADEAWEYVQSRSNSVIHDLFRGQLHSTVQCPHCRVCSHQFDDFMDLSLPLPGHHSVGVRGHECSLQVTFPASTEPQ